MMFCHLFLSIIDFGLNGVKPLSSNSELLFILLEFTFDDLMIGLVQLRELVTVVLLEHAFYAHTDIAGSTEIFYLFTRMSDTFHEGVLVSHYESLLRTLHLRVLWHAIIIGEATQILFPHHWKFYVRSICCCL